MQLSSLLIVMTPSHMEDTLTIVDNMPHISVHHVDKTGHRAIVVTEANDEKGLMALFKTLERTPGIESVSLVNFLNDDDMI